VHTYLPFSDFDQTARALNNLDLNVSITTAATVLNTLHEVDGAPKLGQNNPLVRMWRTYELQLASYGMSLCEEAARRGIPVVKPDRSLEYFEWHFTNAASGDVKMTRPEWLNDPRFLNSERRALLVRDAEHYKLIFAVDADMPDWHL
jgi:hypothetical protein